MPENKNGFRIAILKRKIREILAAPTHGELEAKVMEFEISRIEEDIRRLEAEDLSESSPSDRQFLVE